MGITDNPYTLEIDRVKGGTPLDTNQTQPNQKGGIGGAGNPTKPPLPSPRRGDQGEEGGITKGDRDWLVDLSQNWHKSTSRPTNLFTSHEDSSQPTYSHVRHVR